MAEPEDNSFEIARRLDKYGAGKGPPRPAKRAAPEGKAPVKKRKWSGFSSGTRLLILLALILAGWWWFFGRASKSEGQNQIFSRMQGQAEIKAEATKTIPSINGPGTVPAYTVQVPSLTPGPSPGQTPNPAGAR